MWSCRKSVFPEMQRFLRCGIRNSSSGFWVPSIAILQKGSETTPSSYWQAGWVCVLGIFAIAEILGHTSLESTRIYAKADVETLRSVALDPEEVNHAE